MGSKNRAYIRQELDRSINGCDWLATHLLRCHDLFLEGALQVAGVTDAESVPDDNPHAQMYLAYVNAFGALLSATAEMQEQISKIREQV